MISEETRMVGLPYGEEIMIVGRTMWTQCTSVTDGRTDRQTDRITITKTVQRIASHGKNDMVVCMTKPHLQGEFRMTFKIFDSDSSMYNARGYVLYSVRILFSERYVRTLTYSILASSSLERVYF